MYVLITKIVIINIMLLCSQKKYFGKKIIHFPKRCFPNNNIIYLVFLKIKVGTYFAFESTSHFFACVKLKSFRKLNIRLSVAELCESA